MAASPISERWSDHIRDLASAGVALDVACPFLKLRTISTLFPDRARTPARVLTRLSFQDMVSGVHDLTAILHLANQGSRIRALSGLHAKAFIAPGRACIFGSANLTSGGMENNHEFGALVDAPEFVSQAERWFETLWTGSGEDWPVARLEALNDELETFKLRQTPVAQPSGFPDYGTVFGGQSGAHAAGTAASEPIIRSGSTIFSDEAPQFILKLFGTTKDRRSADASIIDELHRGTAHFAYSYPKRPRNVQDGAVMFAARLGTNADGKHETWVYGRAIGSKHRIGQDKAAPDEIRQRSWLESWPYYVRVHSAEFVNGTFGNGVPLFEFLREVGPIAFETTKARMARGENPNPMLSLRNQAQVRLSVEGFRELNVRLERCFAEYGKVPPAKLAELDWPEWARGAQA